MSHLAIQAEQVQFSYNGTPVLRDVTFSVPRGTFFGLVGPNGCGKSTMMRLILGLLEPTCGHLAVLDQRPAAAVSSGGIGYVPQRETYGRHFPLTVSDVVLMGRVCRVGIGRRPSREDRRKAAESLELFGVQHLAPLPFAELSGGQQRLVLTARALAQEPDLLLMDEADTGLDARRRSEVYHKLNHLRRQRHLTILAISHQLDLLSSVVDTAMALRGGVAVEWCTDCMHHAVGEPRPGEWETIT